ncbi:MAG: hypothetical protein WBZ36_30700 [Candidatus Nitrosopolaris sp.]
MLTLMPMATTISKICGGLVAYKRFENPQPPQQPPQNIYNMGYSIYRVSLVANVIFAGYILILENLFFLRGLRGFAVVVLRYKDPQGPQLTSGEQNS